jgi:ADP-ribose pyrophosphatase YjhB (NUDIX family)
MTETKPEKDEYRCPKVTVDAIIYRNFEDGTKIILIKRKNPPYGWALPGGFVDYGESVEDAVVRETEEETNLNVYSYRQQQCYSRPVRDARCHAVSIAFQCLVDNWEDMKAKDDAKEIKAFPIDDLPELAFDHAEIIDDFKNNKWESHWYN